MIKAINASELLWEPHPFLKELLIKKFLSFEEDGVDLNIMLMRVKKGGGRSGSCAHQDDIVYQLEGRSKM